jgi:hypothetical protein
MDGLEGGILSNFIRFHLIIAIYNSIMSSHALIASAIAAIVTGTSKLLDSNPSSIVFFQDDSDRVGVVRRQSRSSGV